LQPFSLASGCCKAFAPLCQQTTASCPPLSVPPGSAVLADAQWFLHASLSEPEIRQAFVRHACDPSMLSEEATVAIACALARRVRAEVVYAESLAASTLV
jgi:hypothetical protein